MSSGRAVAAVLLAATLLVSGCGTRASEDEVLAGVSTGPVQLDQTSLDQLAAGAQVPGGAPTTNVPGTVDTGTVPGTVTTPGTTDTSTITTPGTKPAASGTTAQTADGKCTGQGAPLNLGQIGSFSGVLGAISASARTTLAIWAKAVNARGGVACHPVTVFAADDGADPSRGAAAAQDLIVNKKVSSIVGVFTPLSMPAILPVIEKYKVPIVGGDGVDFAWTAHPLLFPQGASLDGLIDGGLRQTVSEGKKRLGLLYCVEASICTAMAKIIPAKAKAAGAELVYQSPVSLTQTDFTAQCQNAKNAGVDGFGMGVDGSAIARVARSCAALGYFPQFISGGGVISPAQSKDPGIRRNTLSVASGNAPWMLTDTAGQKEYAAALATFSPGMETDGNSMTAWASAKLFEAAIANLGTAGRDKPILAADVLTGLGKIKNETLDGLAPPITFSPGQKAAPSIKCIYFELLTDKGWTAPKASKYQCTP
ncbi:MAG: ABC transporter substrate-binding protein [Sporichthya sp.]|nr:ABC transporter substrate-binding protein [Sporichthya sp.]